MTRREALALGAAAGVTATVGSPGTALAAAVGAAAASGPEYLRRSTYAPLVGQPFLAGEHALTLLAVGDVQGAKSNRDLAGHEHAFLLEFDGPADVVESTIHQVHHPEMGPFPMYIGPSGPVRGLAQGYVAVIDRSVRLGRDVPSEAPPPQPETGPEPENDAPAPSERDQEILQERAMAAVMPRAMRRRRARRARRALRDTLHARARYKRKQALIRKDVRRVIRGWHF